MCCDELLKKLPSTYLEACRDAYMAGNGIVRKIDLDKILRAAIKDTLPKDQRSTDGEDVRRSLKGDHRIVLPEIMGPVLVPASLHFETTSFPPYYSFVEVSAPDRTIESVKVAGIHVRPPGSPMIVYCFGHPAEVDKWIQVQRGRPPETTKPAVVVWEYYRSCGIEAGPAACATVSQPPVYDCCTRCSEMIGPKGCVNVDCPEHDGSWLTDYRPKQVTAEWS